MNCIPERRGERLHAGLAEATERPIRRRERGRDSRDGRGVDHWTIAISLSSTVESVNLPPRGTRRYRYVNGFTGGEGRPIRHGVSGMP